MFWVTVITVGIAAVFHSARTGDLFRTQSWPERIARFGTTGFIISIAVAFAGRASVGGPFLWFHWLTLVAAVVMVAGYARLALAHRADTRRLRHVLDQAAHEIQSWLEEVEHFDPCHNPDCERIRDEMRTLAVDLGQAR